MYYDTVLFLEILNDLQAIRSLGNRESDGFTAAAYEGISGNLVLVDTSFEDITFDQGRVYLRHLGLDHLIPALFPVQQQELNEVEPAEEE